MVLVFTRGLRRRLFTHIPRRLFHHKWLVGSNLVILNETVKLGVLTILRYREFLDSFRTLLQNVSPVVTLFVVRLPLQDEIVHKRLLEIRRTRALRLDDRLEFLESLGAIGGFDLAALFRLFELGGLGSQTRMLKLDL